MFIHHVFKHLLCSTNGTDGKERRFRVLLMTFLLKEKANRKKEANTDLSQVGRLSV